MQTEIRFNDIDFYDYFVACKNSISGNFKSTNQRRITLLKLHLAFYRDPTPSRFLDEFKIIYLTALKQVQIKQKQKFFI